MIPSIFYKLEDMLVNLAVYTFEAQVKADFRRHDFFRRLAAIGCCAIQAPVRERDMRLFMHLYAFDLALVGACRISGF